VTASVVIACDGVNSFVAKEAGLYGTPNAKNFTLGVKETISLPKHVIDERFGVRDREGVDIEVIGCTGGVNGGGFVYTNLETVAVGVVLKLTQLAAQKTRPEDIIASMKRHSAIAPLIDGGELDEYSAHLIPEAGLSMMPEMTGNGLLVAGDAAALCLAAGIWLEGVNFAMASGMYAGQTVVEAIGNGDVSQRGLGGYARRLSDTFVLRDHRKLRRAPELVLSDRVQHMYPSMVTSIAERMFRVDNPAAKPGLRRIFREERKAAGVHLRDLISDGRSAFRSFG
jgi:electron transfer flavoprotein-quinone oxidoreductase